MKLTDMASTKIAWRKAEIHEVLLGFGQRDIQMTINETIVEEMGMTMEKAKNCKIVRASVAKIIFSKFE
jgi:hypothetical protein